MRFSDIVLDDPKISLAAKGIFAMLGLTGNSSSVAELAERTSNDDGTIQAALDELATAGYVEVVDDTVRVQSAGNFGAVS